MAPQLTGDISRNGKKGKYEMTHLTPKQKVVDFLHVVKTCETVLETVPDNHLIPVLAYLNASVLTPYCEGQNPTSTILRMEEMIEAFYAAINCGEAF